MREFHNPLLLWGPGGQSTEIDTPIVNLDAVINNYIAGNPVGWVNNLTNGDSPREWVRSLNLREIYRFKAFIEEQRALIAPINLIDNANYATDDLVKARSLSGTFWEVDRNNVNYAEETFSGTLVPGQAFGNPYEVYTCVHGFSSGNINNDLAYYFVPYGVMASSNPADGNYVTARGFMVTNVRHFRNGGDGANLGINDPFFNTGSMDMDTQTLYSNRDYAVATIEAQTTVGATPLRDILVGTGLNFIDNLTLALPALNTGTGNNLNIVDNTLPFDPVTERLFVIGLATEPGTDLDHGIVVSTSLTNEGALNRPRRSFADDENTKLPLNIGSRIEEDYSSLADFPGISGGAILRCRLDPNNVENKRCQIIGTNWGAERIFINNDLEKLGHFINKTA